MTFADKVKARRDALEAERENKSQRIELMNEAISKATGLFEEIASGTGGEGAMAEKLQELLLVSASLSVAAAVSTVSSLKSDVSGIDRMLQLADTEAGQ